MSVHLVDAALFFAPDFPDGKMTGRALKCWPPLVQRGASEDITDCGELSTLRAIFLVGLASDALAKLPTEEALALIRSDFPKEELFFVYEVVEGRNGGRFIGLVRPLSAISEQHQPGKNGVEGAYDTPEQQQPGGNGVEGAYDTPEQQQPGGDGAAITYGAEFGRGFSTPASRESVGKMVHPAIELWEAVAGLDHTALVADLYEAAKAKIITVVPEGYAVYDYSAPTAEPNSTPRRFVLDVVAQNGRIFLVGAGFRCAPAEGASSFLIVGAYIVLWGGLSLLFLREGGHFLVAGVIGVFGAIVLYLQYAETRSRLQEIEFSSALRSTSIAIAAASLGVSIFLRTTKTKDVLMLVLVGFFLAIVPLALSGVVFGGGALAKVNSTIIVMLALSVSCILAVLIIALPGAGNVSAFPASQTGAE